MSAKNKKNVLKKCLGRSCAQAVTFKTKRLLIIQKKKKKRKKKKEYKFLSVFGKLLQASDENTHAHTLTQHTHIHTHTSPGAAAAKPRTAASGERLSAARSYPTGSSGENIDNVLWHKSIPLPPSTESPPTD